jgi:hypothetical protein
LDPSPSDAQATVAGSKTARANLSALGFAFVAIGILKIQKDFAAGVQLALY